MKITITLDDLFGNYSHRCKRLLLGSNHILPTRREGTVRGSLSVLDFVKITTHVSASKKALSKISKPLQVLTDAEGLPNHYKAVEERLL